MPEPQGHGSFLLARGVERAGARARKRADASSTICLLRASASWPSVNYGSRRYRHPAGARRSHDRPRAGVGDDRDGKGPARLRPMREQRNSRNSRNSRTGIRRRARINPGAGVPEFREFRCDRAQAEHEPLTRGQGVHVSIVFCSSMLSPRSRRSRHIWSRTEPICSVGIAAPSVRHVCTGLD